MSQSASVLKPTLEEVKQYWNSINDNGHIIESSSNANVQRLHELELLSNRIVWQGTAFKDWVIYVRNNHPMFSMFFADSIHPYSRFERLCVWVACFGYSFLMASYTVELTSPSDCDKFTGVTVSEIKAKFDCQLGNPGYFGFTFGAISAASFALNMILESLSICKCALTISNESKAAKREKTGRFFLLFIVLVCVGLLGWGASRINNKDYAFKKGSSRTDAQGQALEASPSAFILSFVVGQVGGWVAWFFIWALWFKLKYGRARADEMDIRVRLIDGLPIDNSHISNHPAYGAENLGVSSGTVQQDQIYQLPPVHHQPQQANPHDSYGQPQPQAYAAVAPQYPPQAYSQQQFPMQQQYSVQQQYPQQHQYPQQQQQQQYYYGQQ